MGCLVIDRLVGRPVALADVLQPRCLAGALKAWITALENVFCRFSDLFNCVGLSGHMWHLFGQKINVKNPANLWVEALRICLLDFKLANTAGGQQTRGKPSELPVK